MFKPRLRRPAPRASLPPIANWHAGPSGMAYNPGTALSDAWKKHFFVTSFVGSASTARVYAFKLDEKGAGFTMGPEQTLLKGILAVGLRIGPDGALYVTDWIQGWDSKNKGPHLEARHAGDRRQRRAQGRPVDARRGLREGGDAGGRAAPRRTPTCASGRRRSSTWSGAARARRCSRRRGSRPAACHGCTRSGAWPSSPARMPAKAGVFAEFLTDQDGEIRAQAARMIGDVKAASLAPKLLPLLMDTAPRARYFAAEAIARTAYKAGGPAVVDMLADNDGHDMYIQHVGVHRARRRSATPRRSKRCRSTRRGPCARPRWSRSAA